MQTFPTKGAHRILRNCRVEMRDGVSLATDVHLPGGMDKAPALLVRTPYDRRDAMSQGYSPAAWYANQGFAVVLQDVRGRWQSEGSFYPFAHERSDGIDTVNWIADQTWCTGAVGMYGFSYGGATQLLPAAGAPAALRAIAPGMTGSSYFDGWTYRGGTLQLAFVLSWSAQLGRDQAIRAGDAEAADAFAELLDHPARLYGRLPVGGAIGPALRRYVPYLQDWLEHSTYDNYWKQWSPRELYGQIRVPGLHIAGWYDTFLEGTIENFCALQELGYAPQTLIIGPWHHMPWSRFVEQHDFGEEAVNRIDEFQVAFFQKWLSGATQRNITEDTGAVHVFVMGVNQWRKESSWPPSGARDCTWYLGSGGRANSLNGDGYIFPGDSPVDTPPDTFPSNPRTPVLSLGGRSCCFASVAPMGPADQRAQEVRNDVLIYDSDTLGQDLLIIGTPAMRIFMACDAPETQLVAKLVDVYPDGRAINISDGIVCARAANYGEVVEVRIVMSPTGIRIPAGHRVRLEIAGSNFPSYARHSNSTSDPLRADWPDMTVAIIWIFHDLERPSALELPIIPT